MVKLDTFILHISTYVTISSVAQRKACLAHAQKVNGSNPFIAIFSIVYIIMPGVVDPSLVELARKFNQDKQVCRQCYCRLDAKAVSCRKQHCKAGQNQLRPKKKSK